MSIAIGDAFLVKGGSNSHGAGTQIALVRKITKQGNVYCFKISKRTASVVARNGLHINNIQRELALCDSSQRSPKMKNKEIHNE